MSRQVDSLIPGKYPSARRVQTFASRFDLGEAHFDLQWVDRGFPWHYQNGQPNGDTTDQPPGEQTLINGEGQYYLKPAEITGSCVHWPNDKPYFFRNDALILSAVPIADAPQYLNIAYAVVNGYRVKSASGTQLVVYGQNYYDRRVPETRYGIDRYLTDGHTLRAKASNTIYDVNTAVNDGPATDFTVFDWFAGRNFNAGESFVRDRPSDGIPYRYEAAAPLVAGGTWDATEAARYTQVSEAPTVTLTLNTALSPAPNPGDFINIFRLQDYVSGMATTRKTFSQKYGSYRVKMKFPKGQGTFAAAWLWRFYVEFTGTNFSNRDKSPEIDIGEALGHATDIVYCNLHAPENSAPGSSLQGYFAGNTALDHSNSTPSGAGWTGGQIQQHQRIQDPGDSDYVDPGAEAVEFIFEHYPPADDNVPYGPSSVAGCQGNSARMFFLKDGWPEPLMVYESYMTPDLHDGVIDAHVLQLNMAMEGNFNYDQEINDASYPRTIGPTPAPWEFEVHHFDVYQWEGQVAGGAGMHPTDGSEPTYTATPGDTTGNSGSGVIAVLGAEKATQPQGQLVVKGTLLKYRQALPEGADPADFSFAWAHTGGTAATFHGATDKQEVIIKVVEDVVAGTLFNVTCDYNLI